MKYKFLLSLILLIFIVTGTAAAAAKPVIKADTTYYDFNTGLHVLKGNVYIEARGRVITAGEAKVSLDSLEVWGQDGITLTQESIYLVADNIHVYGYQNRAIINGGVTFKQPGLTIIADTADFNWRTKLAVFSSNVQITQGDLTWSTDTVTYNVETNILQ